MRPILSEQVWLTSGKRRSTGDDVDFAVIATSIGGRLKSVQVQEKMADNDRFDEYKVGDSGEVTEMKRTLYFPDTAEQLWQIREGKPFKVSESWRQFKTNKRLPPDNDYAEILKNYPIMMRVSDFPFSDLITDTHPEKWQNGMRCKQGNMDKLDPVARRP